MNLRDENGGCRPTPWARGNNPAPGVSERRPDRAGLERVESEVTYRALVEENVHAKREASLSRWSFMTRTPGWHNGPRRRLWRRAVVGFRFRDLCGDDERDVLCPADPGVEGPDLNARVLPHHARGTKQKSMW